MKSHFRMQGDRKIDLRPGVEWYKALIDGRMSAAQYLEPRRLPRAGRDRNCGERRSTDIVSGEIGQTAASE